MVDASQRGRSNQRKGGHHERKVGKKLSELTGFTFQRNLEQRRQADHLGDLLCIDANFPFAIENKFRSKGNGIPAGAWDQAVRTARKTGQWPSVIYQNGRAAGQFYWPRLDKLFHVVIFDTILRSELNVFCTAYVF